LQRGEYDRAITDCTEAIRLDSKLVLAYQHRARAYRALGDEPNAAADEKAAGTSGKTWWQFWRK
jgi:Tfp pilus assembly protein PilF